MARSAGGVLSPLFFLPSSRAFLSVIQRAPSRHCERSVAILSLCRQQPIDCFVTPFLYAIVFLDPFFLVVRNLAPRLVKRSSPCFIFRQTRLRLKQCLHKHFARLFATTVVAKTSALFMRMFLFRACYKLQTTAFPSVHKTTRID